MALYLKEVALLETTTNTLLKLTNVMEGIEGSAVFGYQTENINIQTGANRTEQVVTRHTFDIRIKDDADPTTQATLTAWANNPELRFKASGYSGDTFFLWDEPVPIVFSRAYDLIGARHLIMTLDAVPGYNGAISSSAGRQTPVYAGQNLFGLFAMQGFYRWSGGGVTVTATGANTDFSFLGAGASILSDFLLPFGGVPITFSFSVAAERSGPLTITANAVCLDSAGTVLSTTAITSNFNDGLIRKSATITTPANTHTVRLNFVSSGSSAPTTISINTPAIRLGAGESTFVN